MKEIKFSILLLCFCTVIFANNLFAQETNDDQSKLTLDFGADVVSRYVWRGTQFGGNAPSIQPALSVGLRGFELGAWGAYSLSGQNYGQEFDLFLSYTFLNEMFTLTVSDYYFPDDSLEYNYVEWNRDATGHILEGTVAFNGTENLPLRFLAAFNFYGNDAITLNDDFSKKGIQYSNNIELGYSFAVNSILCDAFIGGTLSNPNIDKGEAGFYGTGPGIVNIGLTASKDIAISDKFSLPVTASIITNPQAESVFFVFGFSF